MKEELEEMESVENVKKHNGRLEVQLTVPYADWGLPFDISDISENSSVEWRFVGFSDMDVYHENGKRKGKITIHITPI